MSSVRTSFELNTSWSSSADRPETVMFRIKPETVYTGSTGPTNNEQKVFSLDTGLILSLEYNGFPNTSGSYDGSIVDPEYQFGNLVLYPEGLREATASLNLPFFNGDWWSVKMNYFSGSGYQLSAKNKNPDGVLDQSPLYSDVASVQHTSSVSWLSASTADFGGALSPYSAYSGGLQEIRYYAAEIKDGPFTDFALNPLSFQGTTINSSPDELAFRATLGAELYTGSTSIHPKVDGIDPISSFATSSDFNIVDGTFRSNRERIAMNQIAAGVRSEVNDRFVIDDTPGVTNLVLLEQLRYLTQENNGRLIIGDVDPDTIDATVSPFRTVQQRDYDNQRDDDSRYMEVGFSPQNQINDDIVNQIGYFNIGDYIGDPRNLYNDDNKYPDLDKLRDSYFEKYTKSYNLRDFVRLIKFFDNSLFKMIKDYSPTNVSMASGVIIKQHILERNRHRATKMSSEELSKTSASIDVVSVEGGTGGVLDRYQDSPTQFNLTQSWDEIVQTLSGSVTITHTDEMEFYTGEFGYPIAVTASGVDCSRFINPVFEEENITPVFLTTTDYTEEQFLQIETSPERGVVWFWYVDGRVKHIKVSNFSRSGKNIARNLEIEENLTIFLNRPSEQNPPATFLPNGVYQWIIDEKKPFDNYTYYLSDQAGSPNIIYSEDVDALDYNFRATGDFVFAASNSIETLSDNNPVIEQGITASLPQNYFPAAAAYPREQFIRGWNASNYLLGYQQYINSNGIVSDNLGYFNVGRAENSTANATDFRVRAEVSQEPWFMNASSSFIEQLGSAIIDPDPQRRTTKFIAAILLTPPANCSNLNINQNTGIFIGVDYDIHSDLFTRNSAGQLVLAQQPNGDLIERDLILYNPNGTSTQWHPDSVINAGTANTNPAIGTYGVFRNSVLNNDRALITLDVLNNRRGVKSIFYCPS